MKFLNLNMQGLALLLLFVFISCDKLLPTGGSGELVPVKIRSVSVKGYGEASATRSTGGERRIVGQPVVQDLGDGMLAKITVEEDVLALRAGDKSLSDKVKFRVIAVNSSDDKVYSYADYTAGSSTIAKVDNSPELHVVSGGSYYFVCISYNNSDLPPAPELNATLGDVSVTAGSNDLLYQTFTPQGTIPATGLELSFTGLTHQLARVTLKLNGNGKTITNIADNSIRLDDTNSGNFNLKDSTFSNLSGNTVFTGWTPAELGVEEVTSGAVTFIPKAEEAYTLSFDLGAVTRMDGATPLTSTSAWTTTISNSKFAAGSSYTIVAKLYKKIADKFAGSNIYWDGDELTFDEYNVTGKEKYQGVYFKWGSLIGISPAQTSIEGSDSDDFSPGAVENDAPVGGTPIYLKVNGEWKKTNVAYAASQGWIGAATWDAIPSWYDTDITESALVGMDKHTLLAKSGAASYRGDICNYINNAYRMPTGNELSDIIPDPYNGFTGDVVSVEDNENNQAGRYVFADNKCATLKEGRIFPASGYRLDNSGALYDVGFNGYYRSGSAVGGVCDAYGLSFYYGTGNAYTDGTSRRYGRSVRCVLIE